MDFAGLCRRPLGRSPSVRHLLRRARFGEEAWDVLPGVLQADASMGSNRSPSNSDLSQMMIHAVCHRTETERSHAFGSFEVRLLNVEARQQIYGMSNTVVSLLSGR